MSVHQRKKKHLAKNAFVKHSGRAPTPYYNKKDSGKSKYSSPGKSFNIYKKGGSSNA